MAIIVGVTSAAGQEVDSASKASRVTLYDSLGNEINAQPSGAYMLPVNIRQTAASAAGLVVWAMRNGSTKTVLVRRMPLVMAFDGTAAALTTPRYALQRFTTATPTGGTVLTAIKKRTTYPTSAIADARFLDSGLTTTGMTFETDAAIFGLPIAVTNAAIRYDLTSEMGQRYDSFELGANEGLCIRLNTATVIGVSLLGYVAWDEK